MHETHFQGRAEARYVAFLETVANLRPSLHRYCSRMTGSGVSIPAAATLRMLIVGSCVACLAFVAVRWVVGPADRKQAVDAPPGGHSG